MKVLEINDQEFELHLSENSDPRCNKKYLLTKTVRINRQSGEKIRGLTLKKYT